ncbi:phosphatase domain-containing protein [Rosenbergiella epipactidis]|uniref:phosphatase domain-containing protein n=1 Tax=Rosenbergiella epipactidis TaxID=1544694 RepID=UPI001F4E72D1|nr:HAD family acid phosphatase [Rosenbergiella epipactidis]
MDVIIFDLDGVICDNSHRSHLVPPRKGQHINESWHVFVAECVNDKAIDAGVEFYKAMNKAHYTVILTSRQENFRESTVNWLSDNVGREVPSTELFMRPHDVSCPPSQYKADVVRKILAGGHNILFAVDDDPSVCAALNALGVHTFTPSTICSSLSNS